MNGISNNDRKRLSKALNFLEELNWLLESNKSLDLKELINSLKIVENTGFHNNNSPIYLSDNQFKDNLVGILPYLFLDNDLFNVNSDIADFSESVFQFKIPRYEKRSRFEIIGLIVCEVPKLNDKELIFLGNALAELIGNKEKLKKVKAEKKKANFSWNDTIQKLTSL